MFYAGDREAAVNLLREIVPEYRPEASWQTAEA